MFLHHEIVHEEPTANVHDNGFANRKAVASVSSNRALVPFIHVENQGRRTLLTHCFLKTFKQSTADAAALPLRMHVEFVQLDFAGTRAWVEGGKSSQDT